MHLLCRWNETFLGLSKREGAPRFCWLHRVCPSDCLSGEPDKNWFFAKFDILINICQIYVCIYLFITLVVLSVHHHHHHQQHCSP